MLESPAPATAAARRYPLVTALCWLTVLPGLAWAMVRTAGLERNLLVQLFAFTPYVAVGTLLPLALALVLRRWWAAGVAGLVVVALAGAVLPRAVPDLGGPEPAGPTLRVLTANLLVGSVDPAAVLALVRDHQVDVLAIQELTPAAQQNLERLGLAAQLPHRQVNPENGVTGSAVYARFPLRDGGTRRNGSGFTQSYATILPPDGPPVLVESAHPCAPSAVRALRCWWPDLAGQPAATPHGPVRILAGDFNATLDHVALRRLLDTGYVDAADVVGAGLVGTWGPYDGDRIPPVTIDHILTDPRIATRTVSVHPLPRGDHRAVLAELVLPAA